MTQEPVFEESSGNVFADLGLEDANKLFICGKIGIQLLRLIKQHDIKPHETSELIGISQLEVSYFMNGEFQHFSEEKLLTFIKQFTTVIPL